MQFLLRYQWTGMHLAMLGLLSLLLFLYGFFPMKYHTGEKAHWNDLPNFIEGVSIDGQEVYNAGEHSVVLMVIDGLRYDFVTEEYMNFTGQLLKNKSACIHVSVAEPPTVTMPRIKAMMTGTVSTFADVALNFGAPAVKGDSVLRVATARGRRTVLYGDDTWLRLFPGLWTEADGTTSFFVTDYTEVDNNVTRHLPKILTPDDHNQPTFDFLVLHYLGLDHIGHLEGARSPKIRPKLREMDAVVQRIYEAMMKWDRTGVLIICGDHGMRDAGGHGGSSAAEVLVPLVVIKSGDFQCPYSGPGPSVPQTALAPTLAWLLRAPAPGGCAGGPLPSLLPGGARQRLYLLHDAAARSARAARGQVERVEEREFYKQFQRASKQFAQYLMTNQQSAAKLANDFYEESLAEMAKILGESTAEFDMFAIGVSIALLYAIVISLICLTLFSLQTEPRRASVSHKHRSKAGTIVAVSFIFLCILVLLTLSCAITEAKSSFCSLKPLWIPLFIASAAAFTYTFFITKAAIETAMDLRFLSELNVIDYLLIFGTLLHSWTFFGTSFIEEEHMTWYFMWNTLMFFLLMKALVLLVMFLNKVARGATEVQDKPRLREWGLEEISILGLWVYIIALHRYLRTMNQTGDRWLFLPDTADWLHEPQNAIYLQAHLVIGTVSTVAICLYNLRFSNNLMQIHSAFTVLAAGCILAHQMVSKALPLPILISNWDPVVIVDVFWGLLIAQMAFEVISYLGLGRNKKLSTHKFVYVPPKAKTEDFVFEEKEPWNVEEVRLNMTRSLLHIMMNDLMLIVVLLMRPHNVVLVPGVFVTCVITSKCLDHDMLKIVKGRSSEVLDVLSQTLAHLWIGYVFFFYQGNSNSLASVDLGAGYVGLARYSAGRVAARMGLHAYAAPALAGAALYARLAADSRGWDQFLKQAWRATNILALQRVYSLVVYTVVATVFRHHLFVWTVFSPKLLYDLAATVFTVQALLTVAAIVMLTRFTCVVARIVAYRKL